MKTKNKVKRLEARIKAYEESAKIKSGMRKPGSYSK